VGRAGARGVAGGLSDVAYVAGRLVTAGDATVAVGGRCATGQAPINGVLPPTPAADLTVNASYPSDAQGAFDPTHPTSWAFVVSTTSSTPLRVYTVCVPVVCVPVD